MSKIYRVRTVNDYARYVSAPVLHPLVSVIHYDELTAMRHSLNSYDVYGMFLNDGVLPERSAAFFHQHINNLFPENLQIFPKIRQVHLK